MFVLFVCLFVWHETDAEPDSLLPVMKPLGLFPNRMKSLIAVSERFLSMCGPDGFQLGLDKERKIYG